MPATPELEDLPDPEPPEFEAEDCGALLSQLYDLADSPAPAVFTEDQMPRLREV